MRRRILAAILSVTAVAIVLFGVPLALVVQRFVDDDAALRVERAAVLASRQVPADFAKGQSFDCGVAGLGEGSSTGVRARSTSGNGLHATSATGRAVVASSSSPGAATVSVVNDEGAGVEVASYGQTALRAFGVVGGALVTGGRWDLRISGDDSRTPPVHDTVALGATVPGHVTPATGDPPTSRVSVNPLTSTGPVLSTAKRTGMVAPDGKPSPNSVGSGGVAPPM